MQVKKSSYLDSAIKMIYSDYMEKIRSNATNNKKEECLSIIFELWMFMDRFRNCDLGKYFDEQIHDIIKDLNPRHFTDTERLKSKSEYNIAFIITNLVDTGGASVPHRFILENPSTENKFNQFLLVSNGVYYISYKPTSVLAAYRPHSENPTSDSKSGPENTPKPQIWPSYIHYLNLTFIQFGDRNNVFE